MASWKDGAAYAPIERPDGFATPLADPLPTAPAYASGTPGAVDHPDRLVADEDLPDLSKLAVDTASHRDPRDAFEIAAMTMTSAPGKASGRDPREAFALSASPVATPGPPPPSGAPLAVAPVGTPPQTSPWPAPTSPAPAASPTVGGQATWPAPAAPVPRPIPPGTPTGGQWPAPPPPGQHLSATPPGATPPATQQGRDPKRFLCWLGAALCGIGVVATGAAPLLLLVAGGLGLRTTERTGPLGPIVLLAGTLMVTFGLFSETLGEPGSLAYFVSLAACFWFIQGALRRR